MHRRLNIGCGRPVRLHRSASIAADGTVRRGALLTLGLCAFALAVLARGDGDARRAEPLSIPPAAAAQPHWHEERDAFAARLARAYGVGAEVASEFAGWILEASARQNLAPEIMASVLVTESSLRKEARSVMGATGPAQVRADLWAPFCGGFLDDPEQNVYCGAQILAHYHQACGMDAANAHNAEACALRSYNVGYGNRDNAYFVGAMTRYLAKIERYRSLLEAAGSPS